MKIYKYSSDEEYRQEQIKANLLREHRVWFRGEDLDWIVDRIPFPDVKSVLCHGSRNGFEIKEWQKRYPGARVLGTEISPTALKYDDTIQHDFRKPHHRLTGKFDIIYSNSFDHTNQPLETLKVWKDQLNYRGVMFIEIKTGEGDENNNSRASDPLQFESIEEFKELVREVGLRPNPTILEISTNGKPLSSILLIEQ